MLTGASWRQQLHRPHPQRLLHQPQPPRLFHRLFPLKHTPIATRSSFHTKSTMQPSLIRKPPHHLVFNLSALFLPVPLLPSDQLSPLSANLPPSHRSQLVSKPSAINNGLQPASLSILTNTITITIANHTSGNGYCGSNSLAIQIITPTQQPSWINCNVIQNYDRTNSGRSWRIHLSSCSISLPWWCL